VPSLPLDEKNICSSDGALNQTEIPEKLFIYGGGIVGIEIGSVYQRLGSEVTVVQRGDRICQFLDPDVGNLFLETLKKQGINFLCNTEIKDAVVTKNKGMWLNLKDRLSGSNYVEQADVLLCSIGRSPNTKGLNL
jgi:dihydrolipoamide dehydrogenase